MIRRSDIVEIGKINKPHGVCGEVSVTIPLVDSRVVEDTECVIVDIDNIFVPFFISSCRPKSSETYLLLLDGVNSDTEASLLNNKTLFVMHSAYEKLMQELDNDEMPIGYFVGFEVIDTETDRKIGEIVDVDDSTANVLFVVKGDAGGTCLIPAVEDFVDDVDVGNKRVKMTLPAGILNL